jgi:hypothetical protein
VRVEKSKPNFYISSIRIQKRKRDFDENRTAVF